MSENTMSTKQARAIAALLSERTHAAAADKAQVSERTLYLWLADEQFQRHYQTARREAVKQATAGLQHLTSKAVETLETLLTSSKPTVQLGAARLVLEMSIKAVELEDVLQRLDRLEQAHVEKSA